MNWLAIGNQLSRAVLCRTAVRSVPWKAQYCTKTTGDGVKVSVQKSWAGIKDSLGPSAPDIVGKLIFENLFQMYPQMTNFFKNYGSNVEEIMKNKRFLRHAHEKVFATFDKIIDNLANEKEMDSTTTWLVKVHQPKGVTPPDFLNLGNAIIRTLEQALGKNFTPELRAHWTTVVEGLMRSIGSKMTST